MNFVIPMAGAGRRFRDAGYPEPKMLIRVRGRFLCEWALSSLPLECANKIIFIGLREHFTNYPQLKGVLLEASGGVSAEFMMLDEIPKGQAC